jgi:hypothetical protein
VARVHVTGGVPVLWSGTIAFRLPAGARTIRGHGWIASRKRERERGGGTVSVLRGAASCCRLAVIHDPASEYGRHRCSVVGAWAPSVLCLRCTAPEYVYVTGRVKSGCIRFCVVATLQYTDNAYFPSAERDTACTAPDVDLQGRIGWGLLLYKGH